MILKIYIYFFGIFICLLLIFYKNLVTIYLLFNGNLCNRLQKSTQPIQSGWHLSLLFGSENSSICLTFLNLFWTVHNPKFKWIDQIIIIKKYKQLARPRKIFFSRYIELGGPTSIAEAN